MTAAEANCRLWLPELKLSCRAILQLCSFSQQVDLSELLSVFCRASMRESVLDSLVAVDQGYPALVTDNRLRARRREYSLMNPLT